MSNSFLPVEDFQNVIPVKFGLVWELHEELANVIQVTKLLQRFRQGTTFLTDPGAFRVRMLFPFVNLFPFIHVDAVEAHVLRSGKSLTL